MLIGTAHVDIYRATRRRCNQLLEPLRLKIICSSGLLVENIRRIFGLWTGKVGARIVTRVRTLVSVIRISVITAIAATISNSNIVIAVVVFSGTQAGVHSFAIITDSAVDSPARALESVALAALLSVAGLLNLSVIDKGYALATLKRRQIRSWINVTND